MRIVRFIHDRKKEWGIVQGNLIQKLKEPPYSRIRRSNQTIALKNAILTVPTIPTKIVLVGLNYRNHARELKMPVPREPIIFLKPPTALIAQGGKIRYPRGVRRLDYEGELALVIKRKTKNISPANAARHILGYTCLNDITARDIQKRDIQWGRAKSFDTFCPVGPWIQTDFNPQDAAIQTHVNGVLRQESSTKCFIFKPQELVAFISRIMTLLPGDIISTGTPPGVGPLRKGDLVAVTIEGIGTLLNRVHS